MRRLLLLGVTSYLLGFQVSAQIDVIDSLEQLIETAENKIELASLYTKMSTESYRLGAYNKVLEYRYKALEIYTDLRDTSGMAREKFNLGRTYYAFSQYDKALEFELDALRKYELMNDAEGVASVENSIGLVYYKLGKYEMALEFLESALQHFKATKNRQYSAFALNNIGMVHFDRMDLPRSLKFHLEALEIKQQLGDKSRIVTSLNNIGEIFMEQKDLESALDYFLRSLAMKQELGNNKSIAITACNIGKLYLRTGQYTLSGQYLQMSLQHALDANAKVHQAEAYEWLSELQSKRGNYKNALEYNKLFIQAKDSVFSQESERRIANLQTVYEVEKKDKEIELSQARVGLLEKDAELRENRNGLLLVLSIGLTVILIMLVLSVRMKTNAIRQNKLVHEQENKMNALTITNHKIENERLNDEVEYKDRELSSVTMHIFEKSEMLNKLNEQIQHISTRIPSLSPQLQPLRRSINESLNLDNDWQNFKAHFEQVHPGYFSRLKENFPELTPADHRHCAYIKMNLSTKEIARLLVISPSSVQKSRVRLKKKMGLARGTDLITFVQAH